MSMIAKLNKQDMTCRCPACDEIVEVDEDNLSASIDGNPEYQAYCPQCGQIFYTSEKY